MAGNQLRLTHEQKSFIVQALACFDTPDQVADAVKVEFSLHISRQAVQAYDPTKAAGRNLSKPWRDMFDETRKAHLDESAASAISNRANRLRALNRMAAKAEKQGNFGLAAKLHEQAAREMGNAFTNKRELSGPNGAPLAEITMGMSAKEAAERYRDEIG